MLKDFQVSVEAGPHNPDLNNSNVIEQHVTLANLSQGANRTIAVAMALGLGETRTSIPFAITGGVTGTENPEAGVTAQTLVMPANSSVTLRFTSTFNLALLVDSRGVSLGTFTFRPVLKLTEAAAPLAVRFQTNILGQAVPLGANSFSDLGQNTMAMLEKFFCTSMLAGVASPERHALALDFLEHHNLADLVEAYAVTKAGAAVGVLR